MSANGAKFYTALNTLVLATSALTDLIGSRYYVIQAPQNVSNPYVVATPVSENEDHAHDGPVQIEYFRVQFDLYADTYLECLQIRDALKALLDGYSGTIGNSPNQVLVGACFADTGDASWSDGLQIKRHRQDFQFQIEPNT